MKMTPAIIGRDKKVGEGGGGSDRVSSLVFSPSEKKTGGKLRQIKNLQRHQRGLRGQRYTSNVRHYLQKPQKKPCTAGRKGGKRD